MITVGDNGLTSLSEEEQLAILYWTDEEVIFTDTEAGKDILQSLEQAKPGTLDSIRSNDKEMWNKLKTLSANVAIPAKLEPNVTAAITCCGSGVKGTCGCCGGSGEMF